MLDDPLNLHRVAPNGTTLIPEIPGIIDEDNATITTGQDKTPLSILPDDYCEELAIQYLLPTGKFGYKVKQEVPLSPVKYFNQRLLNFKQTFASDADFTFFARSVVEQHHLKSSINISMQKVQALQITAGTVKQNYKE